MTSKVAFAIAVLVIAANNIFAQNNITGCVTDAENKDTLAGVAIYISNLRTGTTTNKHGSYRIENVKNGFYIFEITYLGYKKKVVQMHIEKDTVVNFFINQSVAELSEVIVTAVTHATELKLSPIIIKPIDVAVLNENGATNLIDGLKNIPGVSQITTGAGISKPTIRGLGYNRVITLYNEIRQEGQQWGDEHGVEIDEYSVGRIEIVKGPGSLMYGSDAIAGVLNFIAPQPPAKGKIKTQVISNYQTNNNLVGYSFSNSGNKKSIQWTGRFSNKVAGNYQNKYDGKVFNSGFNEYCAGLMIGLTKKWGYSHFSFSTYNNKLNMVEGNRDSLGAFVFEIPISNNSTQLITANSNNLKGYKLGIPYQNVNHLRLINNNYFILKNGTINFDLGFQNNKRREFGDVLNKTSSELFFDLNTLNYNFRYNTHLLNAWETAIGTNGMLQKNTNKGIEFLIPNYQLFDAGVFLFAQKSIQKFTFSGGLRFDNRSITATQLILDSIGNPTNKAYTGTVVKFNNILKNYVSYSGSIGFSYQITNTSTLKFNLSRGFRAPNISEIASNGKHEGSLRFEYGTSNLKSEYSQQIDVAYFLSTNHVTLEFTPFANVINNYIFSQKLASVFGGDSLPLPADPTPAYKFAQGNATLIGFEFYSDIHPHPIDWLHIENSFGYINATQKNQTDSTKYLPFMPAPKYRCELKAILKNADKVINNLYLKCALDYTFSQKKYFIAYHTETATPHYTLLSAGIGGNIQAFHQNNFMMIYISAENITDVAYQSHLSRLKYAPINNLTGRTGVFNMGRNFSIKVIFNI